MDNSVLYWAAVVMTFLAGVGVVPTIQLFRAPHPGHRVKGGGPAAPRTVHHGYDTMDVLAEGFQAGQGGELQFGTASPYGWESGSGGPPPGNGTWQPRPYTNSIPSGDSS